MKKSYATEATAMVIGVIAATILVVGLLPFINPAMVDLGENGDYSPRLHFLVPTLLSLPLFGLSWHLNKKAQKIRRESEKLKEIAKNQSQ